MKLFLTLMTLLATQILHADELDDRFQFFKKWEEELKLDHPLTLNEARLKLSVLDAAVQKEERAKLNQSIDFARANLRSLRERRAKGHGKCGSDAKCRQDVTDLFASEITENTERITSAQASLSNLRPDRRDAAEVVKAISGLYLAHEIIKAIRTQSGEEIIKSEVRPVAYALGFEFVKLEVVSQRQVYQTSRTLYISLSQSIAEHSGHYNETQEETSERNRLAQLFDSYASYRNLVLSKTLNNKDLALGVNKSDLLALANRDTQFATGAHTYVSDYSLGISSNVTTLTVPQAQQPARISLGGRIYKNINL